ncbi:hypothetical protein GJAV_G00186220 [Gymnothorax javanicus]|nr:hypothetical protein GJAV_G00186220 [Gymnothorax javanicus]
MGGGVVMRLCGRAPPRIGLRCEERAHSTEGRGAHPCPRQSAQRPLARLWSHPPQSNRARAVLKDAQPNPPLPYLHSFLFLVTPVGLETGGEHSDFSRETKNYE